jgi:hypothetical protein
LGSIEIYAEKFLLLLLLHLAKYFFLFIAYLQVETSKSSAHILARSPLTANISRNLNGELISQSKCKPAALLSAHLQSCIKKTQLNHSTDSKSTVNQTRSSKTIEKLLNERELPEQIGSIIEILFLQEEEINQQPIVFLPEPAQTHSPPNSAQSTQPAPSVHTIASSTSISQQSLELVNFTLDELLLLGTDTGGTTLPTQIRQGELNTPVIGEFHCCACIAAIALPLYLSLISSSPIPS